MPIDCVVELRLVPTGRVAIIVVDEEGNAVRGLWFQFKDASGRWRGWAGSTNNQGRTTSQPLPQGELTASTNHRQWQVDPFTVMVEPNTTITIRVTARKKEQPQPNPR